MSEVTHCHFVLLLNVCEERPLVVDAEREDTMLVGSSKLGAVHGARLSAVHRLQSEAVEGRKHGEFQLQLVPVRDLERYPLIVAVFRNLDVEDLKSINELSPWDSP